MALSKIILLEDDPIIHWDLQSKLRSIDCEVYAHYDSSDAYTASKTDSIVDIIITNLRLDDGWVSDVTLRQMSSASKGLLILTGLGDERYYDFKTIDGPHAVLAKPYTRYQLKRSIRQLQRAS